jgi:hypothetical protein
MTDDFPVGLRYQFCVASRAMVHRKAAPGADSFKKHSILLARPLILASFLKVVNLITKSVLLIVHAFLRPVPTIDSL